MEIVKTILINYWKVIVSFIFLLIAFILRCSKKKPLNDIITVLFPMVIEAVNYTEDLPEDSWDPYNKPQEKLRCAVSFVLTQLVSYFGLEKTADNFIDFEKRYSKLITLLINQVLSTPKATNPKK